MCIETVGRFENTLPPVRLKWKHYDVFSKKILQGISHSSYPQPLYLFHCYTKLRMEIALNAFKCLKKYLPPKEMKELPYRCSLHSFLTHVKSAIDNLTEEINLLYGINPILTARRQTMDITKLLRNNNVKELKRANQPLFTEISNTTKAEWFIDLKNLRNEEAVHGAISGKKWTVIISDRSPVTKLGIPSGVSDWATWCPYILKETNKFLERCYKQM